MKNIYIVKHYWNEENYGATIEPKWLFSKKSLDKEKLELKKVIENYIILSKYNELVLNKPTFEKFNDLYVYFCYREKDDPDPTNNRKVTDINFIVSSRKIQNPCELINSDKDIIPNNNYFIYVFIVFLVIIFILYLID